MKLRTPSGPFTHCGLCDFMKLLIGSTHDAGMKHELILRLGDHYEFQAAQRVAVSTVFAESTRNPREILAFAWDKMDQAKNIIPRVKSLANTQFMKGGTRLVVSLVGVLCPGITQRPIFYTVFEDQVQGSNMICSLLIDCLLEAVGAIGCLPRALFLQADNTRKETKNTITLFCAVWLLCQLQHTRLESIEFAYLVVGHTHDLIDACFAYVSKVDVGSPRRRHGRHSGTIGCRVSLRRRLDDSTKAVHGLDILSVPDFFNVLTKRMKNPPLWKHLRDVFPFHENQPSRFSSRYVQGIQIPNHVRISWGRSGTINVQAKRWVTSPTWSDPIVLCTPDQVKELRELFFPTWSRRGL